MKKTICYCKTVNSKYISNHNQQEQSKNLKTFIQALPPEQQRAEKKESTPPGTTTICSIAVQQIMVFPPAPQPNRHKCKHILQHFIQIQKAQTQAIPAPTKKPTAFNQRDQEANSTNTGKPVAKGSLQKEQHFRHQRQKEHHGMQQQKRGTAPSTSTKEKFQHLH